MSADASRRTLLASLTSIGFAGLAGCSNLLASARGATDIVLYNGATERRSIDVIVNERADDSTVVDTTIELEPNESHTINNEVLMNSDYDVQVTFTGESAETPGYTETQEWNDAGSPLHVIVHDQIVFAVQIG